MLSRGEGGRCCDRGEGREVLSRGEGGVVLGGGVVTWSRAGGVLSPGAGAEGGRCCDLVPGGREGGVVHSSPRPCDLSHDAYGVTPPSPPPPILQNDRRL